MSVLKATASGLVGACALTLIHETARRVLPDAPRLDVLGMRAIARGLRRLEQEPPPDDELHTLALAGDIFSNALYYSLAGLGGARQAPVCGALLGLAAGAGAVVLPEPLGFGKTPSARTPATQAMTIAWYTTGGLAAGLAYRRLAKGAR